MYFFSLKPMLALMLGLGLGISIFLTPLRAQQPFTKLRVLLILDCSYSMYSNWGHKGESVL